MCWWVSHQQRAMIIRGKKDKDGNEDREAVDDSDRMMCSSNGGWGLTPGTHARTYIQQTHSNNSQKHANIKLTPGAQLTQATE